MAGESWVQSVEEISLFIYWDGEFMAAILVLQV